MHKDGYVREKEILTKYNENGELILVQTQKHKVGMDDVRPPYFCEIKYYKNGKLDKVMSCLVKSLP
jgi:hypothetical protein